MHSAMNAMNATVFERRLRDYLDILYAIRGAREQIRLANKPVWKHRQSDMYKYAVNSARWAQGLATALSPSWAEDSKLMYRLSVAARNTADRAQTRLDQLKATNT